MKAKVYFTRELTPEKVVEAYHKLGIQLPGKVAVKVHSGEKGNQTCIDLVMQSDDPGKEHFMERVNSRNGIHTIEAAAELGYGTREYELIEF